MQYVVDGVVVRTGTDNSHEDTEETPQWRFARVAAAKDRTFTVLSDSSTRLSESTGIRTTKNTIRVAGERRMGANQLG